MNPFAIDRAYVVSVRALREVLMETSVRCESRWWVAENAAQDVTIGYRHTEDDLNVVLFKFPKIANIPFPDNDGEIVCLYPISREAVQRGLYWENEELKNDEIRDWVDFWLPIKVVLDRRSSTQRASSDQSLL